MRRDRRPLSSLDLNGAGPQRQPLASTSYDPWTDSDKYLHLDDRLDRRGSRAVWFARVLDMLGKSSLLDSCFSRSYRAAGELTNFGDSCNSFYCHIGDLQYSYQDLNGASV